MVDRRLFIAGTVFAAARPALALTSAPLDLQAAVLAAEKVAGGRIGLAVHDTATGRRFSHRGAELFPMASTFKMLLAAAMLHRIDRGQDSLARAIPVKRADIVSNSPVSEKHIGATASVGTLCEATIIYSDNTAANLLLPAVGGPAGLTAWLRGIGDSVTRLDRIEPFMGEARPGDPRDSTTPDAIAATWERLLLSTILAPASRALLTRWLVANTTGGTRLRAGLPQGWIVGDKTGTGANGNVNDIAIVWPVRANRGALFIASFVSGSAPNKVLTKIHADLARAVAAVAT